MSTGLECRNRHYGHPKVSVMRTSSYTASILITVLSAAALLAGPLGEEKKKRIEVLAGPLKGLPSAAGAHAAKIQAMVDNTWLALG